LVLADTYTVYPKRLTLCQSCILPQRAQKRLGMRKDDHLIDAMKQSAHFS